MAFLLIVIGILLFMAAYQSKVPQLGSQISDDLLGSKGFLVWVVAIFIVGAIGYIPLMRGVSRIFLVLVIVVIVLSNQGIFATLTQVITGNASGSGDGNSDALDPVDKADTAEPVEKVNP